MGKDNKEKATLGPPSILTFTYVSVSYHLNICTEDNRHTYMYSVPCPLPSQSKMHAAPLSFSEYVRSNKKEKKVPGDASQGVVEKSIIRVNIVRNIEYGVGLYPLSPSLPPPPLHSCPLRICHTAG